MRAAAPTTESTQRNRPCSGMSFSGGHILHRKVVDVVMSQRRNRRLPLAWQQPDVDSEPLLHFANLLG